MWTLKQVKKFLKENPINTAGSIGNFEHSKIKKYDDGDISYVIEFPMWSQNKYAVESLLKLALRVSEIGDCYISFHDRSDSFNGKMRIAFYNHSCVGD